MLGKEWACWVSLTAPFSSLHALSCGAKRAPSAARETQQAHSLPDSAFVEQRRYRHGQCQQIRCKAGGHGRQLVEQAQLRNRSFQ